MVIDRGKSPATPFQNMVAGAGVDMLVSLGKRLGLTGEAEPSRSTQNFLPEDVKERVGRNMRVFSPWLPVLGVQRAATQWALLATCPGSRIHLPSPKQKGAAEQMTGAALSYSTGCTDGPSS